MKARQIYSFIVRDLKIVFSDKVALFWLIAWPLIWIFMVAYVFIPPGSVTPVSLDVGVVNHDTNTTGLNFTSKDFIEILSNTTYKGGKLFDVKEYDNETLLVDDLKHGRLDLGIIIPANFSINLTFGTANITVLIGARDIHSASINYAVINAFLNEFSRRIGVVKAEITMMYLEKSMNYTGQYNQTLSSELIDYVRRYMYGIAMPLNATYKEVKPEAYANRANILGWYTIGAIGMMLLYSGFSQGAAAMYREKAAGTLRRILASPVTPSILVVSIILSNIVILLISSIILLITGIYGVGAHILFNPLNPAHWLTPILLLVAAYMSLGIGIILSLFAKSEHGADSLGVALGLFLAFTAGIWFPRSWMPQWMQLLAEYFPVTWTLDTLRNIMVYSIGLTELIPDLLKIAIALIVIIILDIIIYRARLKKYITMY